MRNLAASGLDPIWMYTSLRNESIISGPCYLCSHWILYIISWGIILLWRVPSQAKHSIIAYSPSGSSAFSSLATCILRFLTLTVYIWIVVYYVFAFCGIWLSHLLRNTWVCLRLFCVFLLWLWHWGSLHWPSHLGSGQTTTSTTNMSCLCHCNDYSYGIEL